MAEDHNSLKDIINDCLSQQMSEFEVLKSMYPDDGDIVLTDKTIINDINNFLSNNTEYVPNHLDFKLKLTIDKVKLDIYINLPSSYPKEEEPDIYVRCNQLNRHNESRLNSELSNYIKEHFIGEACLYTAISWLQDKIEYFTVVVPEPTNSDESFLEKDEFARYWVYSHHIYNKKKREEIVKKARELKLSGFSLPGKPGIVCVEGSHYNCKEWWKHIKAMTWKKIIVKKTEVFDLPQQESYKKFTNFQELNMNNKELAKYMHKLGFGEVYNELFGLCSE